MDMHNFQNLNGPLYLLFLLAILYFAVRALRPKAVWIRFKRCKKQGFIKFVFPSLKIKGVFMSTVIKKSQFHDDGTGNLVIHGHIEPVTDSGQLEKVQEGTQAYTSSNEAVATVAPDSSDANKFVITFKGAGDVQVQSNADADLGEGVTTIGGTLDLTLEEDEATKINLVLDDVA